MGHTLDYIFFRVKADVSSHASDPLVLLIFYSFKKDVILTLC